MSTLSAMPAEFLAGTTVIYTRTLPDYPASQGWELALYIAGAVARSITSSPDGDSFLMTIDASYTPTWPGGLYTWSEQVGKDGLVYEVGSGQVEIRANPANATGNSQQLWEEKTLAVIEAALSGQLSSGMASYQIAGRAVSRIPIEDLRKLRADMRAALRQRRAGSTAFQTFGVRFERPLA